MHIYLCFYLTYYWHLCQATNLYRSFMIIFYWSKATFMVYLKKLYYILYIYYTYTYIYIYIYIYIYNIILLYIVNTSVLVIFSSGFHIWLQQYIYIYIYITLLSICINKIAAVVNQRRENWLHKYKIF